MKKNIYIQPSVEVATVTVNAFICVSPPNPDVHYSGTGADPNDAG